MIIKPGPSPNKASHKSISLVLNALLKINRLMGVMQFIYTSNKILTFIIKQSQ